MVDKTNDKYICLHYRSPKINVIEVEALKVLCQSGNEPMNEVNYGDGGFSEE